MCAKALPIFHSLTYGLQPGDAGVETKIGEIKMFLVPDPFERVGHEELAKYEELLTGLQARLIVDDLKKDQRGPRRVLNAKCLVAKDVERAVESMKKYRELLEDPSSGEAAALGR